ncbi:hypothetical protein TNCV_1107351 [Trichonephila clavipes]|nr:hypothetical protein TNCV_1107351 [Trichonephila clavipes]
MLHTALTLLPAISTFSRASSTVLAGRSVKTAMNSPLSDQVAGFLEEGFQNLVLSEHRNNSWHNLLTNLHPEDNSLYNSNGSLLKANYYPPAGWQERHPLFGRRKSRRIQKQSRGYVSRKCGALQRQNHRVSRVCNFRFPR